LLIGLISLLLIADAFAQTTAASKLAVVSRLPDQNGKSVCIDTHLTIAFNAAPVLENPERSHL